MSDDDLRRIQAQLSDLATRIARIEAGAVPRRGDASREQLLRFLDEFRAGEALGEASLGAWIAVCKDRALRGGLRVVQHREGSHAQLLTERIKELGGAPRFELPDATYDRVMAASANAGISDAEKVRAFVARFPDPERALAPIRAVADPLGDDPETQALLRVIEADERATLAFFYESARRFGVAEASGA